ncbi:MAG: hypothetical protein ACOVOF_13940 [Chryseotalea sp.]|jgi:benzodiazapine receptor|nr:tryptophan-rich sensory protein [Flammeovirgaceae bacterium]
MKKPYLLASISTLLFGLTIFVNALANGLPINGLSTGAVSELYPSLFTPAGLTFSIWGIIYLFLAGFIIVHWVKADSFVVLEICRLFWLTCILNVSWIVAWHYLFTAISVTLMLLLLLSLIQIFIRIKKVAMLSVTELIFVKLPFTIYFAWICVATIANISAYLVSVGWDGGLLSPVWWTFVVMGVATVLAGWITRKFNEPVFALVVIWALFGIFWKQKDESYISLTFGALGYLLLLMAWVLLTFIRSRKTKQVSTRT